MTAANTATTRFDDFATLLPGRRVVPVGRIAGDTLGLPPVRHPSHGGAVAFRDGLALAVGSQGSCYNLRSADAPVRRFCVSR